MSASRSHASGSAGQRPGTDPGQAQGVVKIRLSGAAEDIDIIARMLAGTVVERSAAYPNRRDPGVRVYLTALVPSAESAHATPRLLTDSPRSTNRRQRT